MDVPRRVEGVARKALSRAGYAGTNSRLVVAVSGGPDSMALLHCLVRLKDNLNLSLHIAHLNHDFRGEEAEEDARFVGAAAESLRLPATIGQANPMAHQKKYNISSFEAAAREVRYDFLAKVATQEEASAIALGHTADDQGETILMHILRGSGLHGLRGMQELTLWSSPQGKEQALLFRPFLEVTRQDTFAYCGELNIAFRQDSTNTSLHFTRSRLRHELLPILEGYNPKVRESLLRLGRSVSLGLDYLDEEATQLWRTLSREETDSIVLDTDCLKSLHPFMQRLIMRRAYQELTGSSRRLEERHLTRMVSMITSPAGTHADLPQGVKMRAQYGRLVLGKSVGRECLFPSLEGQYNIEVPGITRLPGWLITAETVSTPLSPKSQDPLVCFFDLDRLGRELQGRNRRDGDRFQPLGMAQEKKLQDFFVDQKVPRDWRDWVPLLVSEKGILWVVGYRTAEWCKITKDTRRAVRIEWKRTSPP